MTNEAFTTEEVLDDYGFKTLNEWVACRFLWNREQIIEVKFRCIDIWRIFLGITSDDSRGLTESSLRYLKEDIHVELRRLESTPFSYNGKGFRLKSEGLGTNKVYWMEEVN